MELLLVIVIVLNFAAIGVCVMKAVQANSTGERVVWCVVILLGPLSIIVVAVLLAAGWAMVTNVVAEPDGSRSRPYHVKIKE